MKKRMKVNKKKLRSRILLLAIILLVIIFGIKAISNKEVKKEIPEISLIVDKQDITENLKKDIYISADGSLYMSVEDVKNIFDKNIYYEEDTNKIITTYGTKVGAIDINNNLIQVNAATLSLSMGVLNYGDDYYIPISEMDNIYNIEIKIAGNKAIVLSLYKSLSTMNTTKKVSLKKEPGGFKGTIKKLDENTEVIFIENASKNGWIKVLTYDGDIGYIQKKNLSEENQVRSDMEDLDFTNNTKNLEKSIEINKKTLTVEALKDFSSRKEVVEDIIKKIIAGEKFTVNINLDGADIEEMNLERFIIELIPRLKEIGGNIVVTNNEILSKKFLSENNI